MKNLKLISSLFLFILICTGNSLAQQKESRETDRLRRELDSERRALEGERRKLDRNRLALSGLGQGLSGLGQSLEGLEQSLEGLEGLEGLRSLEFGLQSLGAFKGFRSFEAFDAFDVYGVFEVFDGYGDLGDRRRSELTEDEYIRLSGFRALARSEDSELLPELEKAFQKTASRNFKLELLRLMARNHHSKRVAVLGKIAQQDPDESVRKRAIYYLGKSGSAEAAEILKDILTN